MTRTVQGLYLGARLLVPGDSLQVPLDLRHLLLSQPLQRQLRLLIQLASQHELQATKTQALKLLAQRSHCGTQ